MARDFIVDFCDFILLLFGGSVQRFNSKLEHSVKN
jgi:hypothetical protein